jgi:uncharacterized lipoprotein YddW (UPF0748 family)
MKWYKLFITFILGLSTVLAQTDNQEFRATWVITWEHISGGSSVSQNQARIRTIMDNHVAANMNAVLFQARQSGTAYYNSSYEPWGYYAGGSDPGFDPLEYAVEQAHERGLELHAWFNTFQAASTAEGAPAEVHPEWVCRDESDLPMPSSRALSPGLAEVRAYLVDVAMEIVNNYDIDGLHLDYVRWNEYSNLLLNGVDPDPIAEISALDQLTDVTILENLRDSQSGRYLYDVDHPFSGGVPEGYGSWPEFWRDSVTEFVQTLHDSMQTQKPWVRLSAAALGKYNWSGWNGYDVVYQDAALWFNEGYIDQLTPMHYHWTTGSAFVDMLETGSPNCWGDYIQPGIDAGRMFSVGPGSYILANNNVWTRHASIVNASRTVDWVDGFQFFSYGTWQDYLYWPIAGDTFFGGKTKMRGMGLYVDETPASPGIMLNIIDPLTFEVSVTPDASVTEDQWYAIYRSTADDIDVTQSEILGVFFGNESFTFTDGFDGTQDHDGSFFYAATMLDRYWNESELSASVETSVLPSYPPLLLGTYPAENDTVNVNTTLAFMFSKTMNTESVETAFSITPEIEIAAFDWSEGNHNLMISLATDLEFLSTYTLEIAESATDINGVALDGDGDGTAGGDLVIVFHTKEIDEAGPVLVYSYPEFGISMEDFDVDGSLSLVFDEQLDPLTITDESVTLSQAGEPVEVGILLSGFYGHSVLDVKPYTTFASAADYTLVLDQTVTDTLGNPLPEPLMISFSTHNQHYSEILYIDDFTYQGEWWDPEGSGSTVGTIGSATSFGYSNEIYLPGSSIYNQGLKSAYIRYEWDTTADGHLLREYLPGGDPRNVLFDTTYTLQCYVYGDASYNKFRFALDEGDGTDWPAHEVSIWHTIDWEGWRLLEWDLGDPAQVGSWIGNVILDGAVYRVDSFQMTFDTEMGETSGRIYLDNFRVIKRMPGVSIDQSSTQIPETLVLHQNYPNPFNPESQIEFDVPNLSTLNMHVFDITGRQVKTLFSDRSFMPGSYKTRFNAVNLPAGVYFVRLQGAGQSSVIRMSLIK